MESDSRLKKTLEQAANEDFTPLAVFDWTSPSNIAIVKYWGKKPGQIPMNASLSMTLSAAHTRTKVTAFKKDPKRGNFEFRYDSKLMPDFEPKLNSFFHKLEKTHPFLSDYFLQINTWNTFPHSTGIASSASGMSALALCISSLEEFHKGVQMSKEEFFSKSSYIARIGSGSACRSLFPNFVNWGNSNAIENSSDTEGIAIPEIHPAFADMEDYILIVSGKQKKVSSSAGHQLMNDHPFAESRFKQAQKNHDSLVSVLKNGEMSEFIRIMEEEALSLHAMMMTSSPSYMLFEPESIELIKHIVNLREQNQIPVGFTLDAGPNVHLIFPSGIKEHIEQFVNNLVLNEFPDLKVIRDRIGSGPIKNN